MQNNPVQNKPIQNNPATKQNTTIAHRAKNIINLMDERKEQIKSLLPAHIRYDRMKWIVMNQMRRNPDLFNCTAVSIINCVMQSAQLGLELDDVMGYGYLVPYGQEARFIPGYKGLIKLAYNSGRIENIYTAMVYDKESYVYQEGFQRKLEHHPKVPSARGEFLAVYSVAMMKEADPVFVWLWAEDVALIQKSAKARSGPWISHRDEMIKKTALRRLAKTVQLSPEFQRAAAIDELTDTGVSTRDFFLDGEINDQEVAGKPFVSEPKETTKIINTADMPVAKEDMIAPIEATSGTSTPEEIEPKQAVSEGYSNMIDLMDGMNYSEKQRKFAEDMLKRLGIDSALNFLKAEWRIWQGKQK